jgi:hypothetical protein
MKKKIILGIVAVVVVLGGVLALNMCNVVKRTIETVGSNVLGTAVKVGSFDFSMADKSAQLSSLSIRNPKGFKADYLLQTKKIGVTVDDVSRQLVTLKQVVVDGMTVTYELGPHGSNMDAIKSRLASPAPAAASKSKGSDTNLVIQQLRITNAKVVPAIGGTSAPVPLPDLVLTNIGTQKNPATPAEVATQVMNKVMAASTTALISSGLIKGPFDKAISKVEKKIQGLFLQK